jgi:hypothetical protein
MKEYYIGLDARKDSVLTAVLDERKVRSSDTTDSDVIGTWEVPANSPQLVKAIQRYRGKVFVAYEAGRLGFDLYHFSEKHGITCEIIPANMVFRPGNEKKIKTNRRDVVRDYIRGRGDLADDLTRTKQRIQKFLLRHGYRYENDRYWTEPHIKWMKGLCV